MEGKLWYGSWRDYKKIQNYYDMDFMVSVCRFPPYRYYGNVEKTGVLNFNELGPSPELHKWRKKIQQHHKDLMAITFLPKNENYIWTEYAQRYAKEIGNRQFEGRADKMYESLIQWVEAGYDVCLLCTCKPDAPCHRYLLWNNMLRTKRIPFRGGSIVLDFPEWMLENHKVTDKTWELSAIGIFKNKERVGEKHGVMLACPHPEYSAAYDRLIKKGIFGSDGPKIWLNEGE